MTGQAENNHQVGRHQHSKGRSAHLLDLTRLESVRTSAFNPDSGSFCSLLWAREEQLLNYVPQGQEVTVIELALPLGSKIL